MTIVSIIMPSYNSSEFILEAIKSVQNQTLSEWELIIVDDCSKDSTVNIVEKIQQEDSRIFLLKSEINHGAAAARNRAIEKASGRYIAFLDSDDVWTSSKLEKQISFMCDNDICFSYTAYKTTDRFGNVLNVINVPFRISYNGLLKSCVIGCLTAVYDVKILGKVYMPSIRKRQDFGLWLNLLKLTKYAYGINEPLALYRCHSDSISSDKKSAAVYMWKLYREVEGFSFFKSSYLFLSYAFIGILKTYFPSLYRKFLGV